MKNRLSMLFFAITLVIASLTVQPASVVSAEVSAQQDTSCTALLSVVVSRLGLGYPVSGFQMTSWDDGNGHEWAYTSLRFTLIRNGHLIGKGERYRLVHPSGAEALKVDIDPQGGTMILNDIYGPVPFSCLSDRFVIASSSNSVEVISFGRLLPPIEVP